MKRFIGSFLEHLVWSPVPFLPLLLNASMSVGFVRAAACAPRMSNTSFLKTFQYVPRHLGQAVAARCPLSSWPTGAHQIAVHIVRRHVRTGPTMFRHHKRTSNAAGPAIVPRLSISPTAGLPLFRTFVSGCYLHCFSSAVIISPTRSSH